MAFPASTGPPLREAKQQLRAEVLRRRDALPRAARDAATQRITAAVLSRPEFASAQSVLLTLPFRSEWDTREVARVALGAGKVLVVPRVDVASRMLELHRVEDLAGGVVPGYRGIPEPRADLPRVAAHDIALALVPGVAFDAHGRRLGYGGGYYDRLLPSLDAAVPRLVGAFEVQIVAAVPAAPHDVTVDVIVTEARTMTPPRRAAGA